MLTFRQKILLSYIFFFLLFIAAVYPVAVHILGNIQEKHLFKQSRLIVKEAQSAPSLEGLIEFLNQKEKFLFLRINLYDPLTGKWLDIPNKSEEFQEGFEKEEVKEALQKGHGYQVRYSSLYDQQMAYIAYAFTFQGKSYVLRTAYPNGQISALTNEFTVAFLILNLSILLLFGLFALLIVHYLTRPVQKIINAIKPFQLGHQGHIPQIDLGKEIGPKDEFGQLAETLNALSKRIEHQITTLIQEKNDKAAILESLGEGVIAVDQMMIVTYINRMAEVLLGLKKEEILGKSFSLTKLQRCQELIYQAQTKKESILSIFKPEGKPKKYLDVIAVPLGDKGAILVIQDKTSLHKIIELGRDFIANASHELKTPITIIRGFAETLHDHPELSSEVSHDITQKIVNNCQRMETLVKNLLTLAAIDEGLPRSRLQEHDLFELIEEARQTILAVHPQANIRIEPENPTAPIHMMVDGDLFIQAILNLLDNAVKYSKAPAQVRVRLKKDEKEIHIEISDKGIGIPHEDLDRIFERFYVVDKSHSRSMGGSGLGLSIVERIIEKHQGKISVDSTLDVGTTFTLIFPVRADEHY